MREPRLVRCRGFTLLEALVAFTILVLALSVMLRVFATGARGVASAEDYARAAAYLRTALVEESARRPLELGGRSGAHPDGYRWRTLVRPHRVDGEDAALRAELGLFHVAAVVEWQARGRGREISADTLVLARIDPAGRPLQ